MEVWVSNKLEKIKIEESRPGERLLSKSKMLEGMAVALAVEMVREEYI